MISTASSKGFDQPPQFQLNSVLRSQERTIQQSLSGQYDSFISPSQTVYIG